MKEEDETNWQATYLDSAVHGVPQCPRMDLNKKSGPEQKTTTG